MDYGGRVRPEVNVSDPTLAALADWGNFYVIVGSAGAGLTGLMFVVIALGAEGGVIGSERALRAYATPTVVHFGAVLLLAALATVPGHKVATLSLGVGACGIAGVAYVAWVMNEARRQHDYQPVTSDWVWHGVMPFLAYGALVVTALAMSWQHAEVALYMLAGASVLLLYSGIHNAWDTALWLATEPQRRKDNPDPAMPRRAHDPPEQRS
jgi:hypothetical protein